MLGSKCSNRPSGNLPPPPSLSAVLSEWASLLSGSFYAVAWPGHQQKCQLYILLEVKKTCLFYHFQRDTRYHCCWHGLCDMLISEQGVDIILPTSPGQKVPQKKIRVLVPEESREEVGLAKPQMSTQMPKRMDIPRRRIWVPSVV